MALLDRPALLKQVETSLKASPVVALLGPRQVGKTTLARQVLARRQGQLFDLEDPRDEQRLSAPMTALEGLRGTIVIDEIQ